VSTHDALVDEAEARFGDTANSVISALTWSSYLNNVYQWVNSRTPLWPWLEAVSTSVSVTAGSRSANLPTDAIAVHSVYNRTDDLPVLPLVGRSQQNDTYSIMTTDRGTVQTYRLRGSTIEVFPLPSATTSLQIEYVGPVADITGTTEPVWPEPFHRVLVTGMLALAYLDDGNIPQYDKRWKHLEQEVEGMMRSLLMFRHEGNFPIVDDWYR
jgi:hypothetical protein